MSEDIIDLSDEDDCILECVIDVNQSSKNHSELYYEVCKTNQHLADFIDKCLCLEDTKMMLRILKTDLLQEYYQLEKSVRESPKMQKAIRRANNLLSANPRFKYSHIKDLCEIFKATKVKKKVPFITLTTNLKDKNNEESSLKRCNSTQINETSCKKPKLGTSNSNLEIISHSTEGPVIVNLNETTDILDESAVANSSQESITTDEDNFLVPQASVTVDPHTTGNEERIKKLEKRLAYYQKEIARLDELEVEDDSINSPYIKSERLKSALVVIYKELCQLMGSQPVKRKEIRLRVVDGHPRGPTKVLETFLNNNIDSDGQPPFPDFCDVVNCVMEANKMDDLGWTKCQIMKEAGMLFTQCGRALQKRRQNREYRDLLCKVKEECQRDPAEDDPELLARLEENKRIAIKKENEILERFTMMESLPSKPRVQKNGAINKNTGNEKINKPAIEQEVFNHNNNSIIDAKHNVDNEVNQNTEDITSTEINENSNVNDHNISDESKKRVDVTPQDTKISVDEKAMQGERNKTDKENKGAFDSVGEKSNKTDNIEKQKVIKVRDNANNEKEAVNVSQSKPHNKADSDKVVPNCDTEITNTELTDIGDPSDNHCNEKPLEANNYETGDTCNQSKSASQDYDLKENKSDFVAIKIKQEPEEELSSLLESMGEDFTLVIENIEHPTIIIEISDSSDDELDK